MIKKFKLFENTDTSNLKIIGSNNSHWSYEYDSITIMAYLLLDENNNNLFLKIEKSHSKSGLGSGTKKSILEEINVGTLNKPNLALIRTLLKKHTLSKSSASKGFSRLWKDEEGNVLTIKDLIELNTPATPIKNNKKEFKHISKFDDLEKNTVNNYDIEIVKYSDKSYALFGEDTKKIKDDLINIGCRYNRFLTDPKTGQKRAGWICSIRNLDKINELIKK